MFSNQPTTFSGHMKLAAAKTAVAGVALGLYAGGTQIGQMVNPDAGKPDSITMQPSKPSPAERLQANFDRRLDRVIHRTEFKTGLEYHKQALPGNIPHAVIQHKDVPAESGVAGWKTLKVYDTDQAWRQSDLEHGGRGATHFTDGYFYPRGAGR